MARKDLQLVDGLPLEYDSIGAFGFVQDSIHAGMGLVAGGCFAIYLAYLGMRSEFANPKLKP